MTGSDFLIDGGVTAAYWCANSQRLICPRKSLI